MEKFSRASSSSSMDAEEYEFLEVEFEEQVLGDLSNWEFIDASDADSEEHQFAEEDEPEGQHHQDEDDDDDEGNGSVSLRSSIPLPIPHGHDQIHEDHWGHLLFHIGDLKSHDHDYDYHDDDDDVSDDGYDLNDELVPWSVSDKFGGRERMRKLGKRAFTKMNNSKRSPKLFVRPGCVRGKHGLGLKHSC